MSSDPDGRVAAESRRHARWLDAERAILRRWSGVALLATLCAFILAVWVFDVVVLRDARWLIAAAGGSCAVVLWVLSQRCRFHAMLARALAEAVTSPHVDPAQSVQTALDLLQQRQRAAGPLG